MVVVRAYYKFVALDEIAELKERILDFSQGLDVMGTILLAPEGINSTMAASPDDMEWFWSCLSEIPGLEDIEYKDSFHPENPFKRFKIKLKREIITIRDPDADPTVRVGTYVSPSEWNDVISQEDVVLVDTRNYYEVAEGTFKGAIDPVTHNFGEFPEWVSANLDPEKHPKVAMFCTGGIRCEKASALMLARGFKEVYHLKGGILKYLEEVPAEQSLYEGSCFIFDDRDSIVTGLKPEKRKYDQNELAEELFRD